MVHIVTHRSGHAFNHAFLKTFFNQKESWETLTLNSAGDMARVREIGGLRSQSF